MKLVDKQIVKELIGPFLFGVGAFTSVFFAGTYLLELTNLVMKGMSIFMAIEALVLIIPSILSYTLPMSTLLAVLLGLGRLSGDSEVVALFAGGTSLYRISLPIIIFGLLVSGFAIFLNEYVGPIAYNRSKELRDSVLERSNVYDKSFTFWDEVTQSQISVRGGVDRESGELRDISITKYAKIDGKVKPALILYAEKAKWAGMQDKENRYKWLLFNGYWQSTGTEDPAFFSFEQAETRQIEIRKTPQELELYQKGFEQLSFSELGILLKELYKNPDRPIDKIKKLDVERWNKLAFPLSSLIFAMMAAPLGVRTSRGGSSVGLGLSILVLFCYWMIWNYTSSLAIQGRIEPFVGSFTANVLGAIFSIFLIRRSIT
ncbi:MAG: LptF/LptG family permease [Armatimonadota bacterium]